MLSIVWLAATLVLYLIAAARGGAYHVFLLNIALSLLLRGQWEIAGIALDTSDLMFFVFAAGIMLSPSFARSLRIRTAPHLHVWVFLGVVLSIAYVSAKQVFLTDPVRSGYQLYRYCWKPILFYPVAAALIEKEPHRRTAIAATILALGGFAALLNAGSFAYAERLFSHKNQYGGALIAPAILGVGLLLSQATLFASKWIAPTLGVVWAGLVLSGSRGAFVGAAFGSAFLLAGLLRHTAGRARTLRFASLAILGAIAVAALYPRILTSEGAAMLLEIQKGADVHNLQWRLTERWPVVVATIAEHPWLGTGVLGDADLASARGAHNGYLSVALQRGIPASLLFFCIPLLAVIRARSVFRDRSIGGRERILALAFGSALVGILTHNLVDTTIVSGFTGQLLWVLTATAATSGNTGSRTLSTSTTRPERIAARHKLSVHGRPFRSAVRRRPVA